MAEDKVKIEDVEVQATPDDAEVKAARAEIKEFEDTPYMTRLKEVLVTFWPLGFVAFGGPQAHVAILRDHLVVQRDWLDEDAFMELFAIGQGLPGPTSTQLVVSTALSRAGPLGGLLAFFLWNLPGFIVLTICGVLIEEFVDPDDPPFYLIGLPPAAISLVFKAFYGFGQKLDKLGIPLAVASCMVTLLINGDEVIPQDSSQYVFPIMLAIGGCISYLDSKRETPLGSYSIPKNWDKEDDITMRRIGIPVWMGFVIWSVWLIVLIGSIVLVGSDDVDNDFLKLFEIMYRNGSIIFGGGQVVLPLLEAELVPDLLTNDQFYQGLGLAQSMPGPLFNFSSYIGAVYKGVAGAFVAYVGLFGPGVILIFGMVPFWARLRKIAWFKAVLNGVNAAAIGLVGAACVILWEAAIFTSADAIVFVFAGSLATLFNVQAPLAILAGGVLGAIMFKDAASLGQVEYCDESVDNARRLLKVLLWT